MQQEEDPVVITSPLSRKVTKNGITVDVQIYRLEHETQWGLEVVNAANTSTCWEEPFPTDEAAYQEFCRTIETEGMLTFVDDRAGTIH
jgi:hypothetical protein